MPQPAPLSDLEPEEFSCGFLVLREKAGRLQFLLMQHKGRWDLPKGHVDAGESKMQCALRELWEETGIRQEQIQIDPGFEFIHHYVIVTRKGNQRLKQLTIYLAKLLPDFYEVPIAVTEHQGCRWFNWQPPHQIETRTIDGLLATVAKYWAA